MGLATKTVNAIRHRLPFRNHNVAIALNPHVSGVPDNYLPICKGLYVLPGVLSDESGTFSLKCKLIQEDSSRIH